MQSVRDAIQAELEALQVAEVSPGMAAAAVALAAQIDNANGATAAANAAAQLRMIMNDLHERAPVDQQADGVTHLLAVRNERRAV